MKKEKSVREKLIFLFHKINVCEIGIGLLAPSVTEKKIKWYFLIFEFKMVTLIKIFIMDFLKILESKMSITSILKDSYMFEIITQPQMLTSNNIKSN